MKTYLCPTCHGSGAVSDREMEMLLNRQPHTRSRPTSTLTSNRAARMLRPETCRTNHNLILKALTNNNDGLTDEQISFAVNKPIDTPRRSVSSSTLRARRSELMHAGMVIDSGRRSAKTDTGRPSAVWVITQLGRLASNKKENI